MIKLLEGKSNVTKWTTLEDLAIKNEPSSEPYQLVLADKGQEELDRRLRFLELSK